MAIPQRAPAEMRAGSNIRARLRRFAPLAVIVLGDGGGIRERGRTATCRSKRWSATAWRSTPSSTAHAVAAVAVFMAIYVVVVALSIPGALVPVRSPAASCSDARSAASPTSSRATIGATIVFLVARSACGEGSGAPRRAARQQARRGFPRGRVQLSAVPAAGAGVSVLSGQSRARAGRRETADLRRRDRDRHHARRPSRLRSSARASTACSPRRRLRIAPASPPAASRMHAPIRHRHDRDAATACGARRARRDRARSRSS